MEQLIAFFNQITPLSQETKRLMTELRKMREQQQQNTKVTLKNIFLFY